MNTRNTILLLIMTMLLLGAGCGRVRNSATDSGSKSKVEELAPLATVSLNGGKAEVNRAGKTDPVNDGLELLPGDEVKALQGTIALVYPEAGISYLEEGSSVVILPDGEGEGSVFVQIELVAGSIWSRFERLLGADEKFSVSGNGVVATVRGTAFGAEKIEGGLDVQVANDEVEVKPLAARKNPLLAGRSVRLKNGQGLKVTANFFNQFDPTKAARLIRTLSEMEKRRRPFQGIAKPLAPDLLKRRMQRVRLDRPAAIPEIYRDRIDPYLLQKLLLTPGVFVLPSRGVLPREFAPTTTPTLVK